jgi:hemoglobin
MTCVPVPAKQAPPVTPAKTVRLRFRLPLGQGMGNLFGNSRGNGLAPARSAARHWQDIQTMEQTLFQKYGGFSKISRIVLDLYDRLLEDDEVGPFFDEVDMARIVDHQTKFLSSLLGGPASYSDDQISKMHRHLTINARHFDTLAEILAETLADHGVEPGDVEAVVQAFEARRKLVVE